MFALEFFEKIALFVFFSIWKILVSFKKDSSSLRFGFFEEFFFAANACKD